MSKITLLGRLKEFEDRVTAINKRQQELENRIEETKKEIQRLKDD